MSKNLAELVFVPTPAMGHLLSMVKIAKTLVQRYQHISISIYILNLPSNSPNIEAFVDSQSRDNPYPTRLNYVTLAQPLLSNPPSSSFSPAATEQYKPLIKHAVQERIRAGFSKPVGFVLDVFRTTISDVADELHLPTYIFFTSGVNALSLFFLALSLAEDEGIDVASKFSDPDLSLRVPGFKNPIGSIDIPSVLKDKESDLFFTNFAKGFKKAKGILVNSYEGLESDVIQALVDGSLTNVPPIYPVGPILELGKKRSGGGSRNEEHESIMKWLDGQPKSSVVFLCFGSMGSFDEDQVKEIATGLDQSGHRFLWALRNPSPEGKLGPGESEIFSRALPDGFVNRTAHKGKVIGWAPQIEILAHPSIGGFVTHCGWNSTLESIWFGVPVATWPLYAEQHLNAFSLVKEMELAIEIEMDYKKDANRGKSLVTAEEIENGVKKLMSTDNNTRERVKEVSSKGRKALENEGSSYRSLDQFIEDVLKFAV